MLRYIVVCLFLAPKCTSSDYTVGAYYLGMWSSEAYNPVDLNFGDRNFYIGQGEDFWLGVRTIHDGNLSVLNQNDCCYDDNIALGHEGYQLQLLMMIMKV